MIVWGRKTSINVQKVTWVLAECGQPYEQIDAGGTYGGLQDQDYLSMNPNGRVPTLVDGDLTLWESNAISRYLVNAYGGPLAGDSAADTARADMWMEWFQSTVYTAFIAMFYQTVRLPETQRDPAALTNALDTLHAAFGIAESALSQQPFLAGPKLSLADVPFGACLFRYFTVDIDRPDWPAIERYYEQLCTRPSYRENVMVDYSSLQSSD